MLRAIHLLTLVAVACCALPTRAGRAADNGERLPNLVLIVSDDQGYRDLGCYGGPHIKTPHLDRLAAAGVRLTDFYVTWPACTPSRGSILTGRYPQRNGLYDMIRNDMVNYGHRFTEMEYRFSPEMTLGLDRREVTIADVLKKAGYATGVVGKWDSGRAKRWLPLQRGFDFFYGFCNTGIDYWTHQRYGIESMFRGNERIEEEGYATNLFRREAVRFIHRNKDRPFFLYVPFNAPHGASSLEYRGVQAPDEYLAMYDDVEASDGRRRYMGAVTCMDDAIGEILATLAEHGLEENTLVMFFSDNGGSGIADNTPLRGRKATMYEGGLRVPCLVKFPGRLPAGAVNREFLSTLEILPTFAALAGAQPPEDVVLDGFDMLPTLDGREPSRRKSLFSERRYDRAARVGHWKWLSIRKQGEQIEALYDLSKDIGEQHNLAGERPEVLKKMRKAFAAWKEEMEAAEPRGPFRNY